MAYKTVNRGKLKKDMEKGLIVARVGFDNNIDNFKRGEFLPAVYSPKVVGTDTKDGKIYVGDFCLACTDGKAYTEPDGETPEIITLSVYRGYNLQLKYKA